MATSNGRNKSGKFTTGNKHGRGAVTTATRADRLTALLSVVTAADWAAVCATAVKQARRGDWRARQWLASYLLPAADAISADGVPQHVFSHGNFLGALTGRAADVPVQVQAYDYYAAVASIAAPAVDADG